MRRSRVSTLLGIAGALLATVMIASVSKANAAASAPVQYKVITMSPAGFEAQLNQLAAQGWRFSGAVGGFIVMEK